MPLPLTAATLWTTGSFGNVTGDRLLIMTALCLSGLLLSVYNIKDLNVLLMGEQYAQNSASPSRVRNRIFLATTLLAGSATVLRPHRFYRDCRAAYGPDAFPQRKPPRHDTGLSPYRGL